MPLYLDRSHLNTGESVSFLDAAGPVLSMPTLLHATVVVHPLGSAVGGKVAVGLLQLRWKPRLLKVMEHWRWVHAIRSVEILQLLWVIVCRVLSLVLCLQ